MKRSREPRFAKSSAAPSAAADEPARIDPSEAAEVGDAEAEDDVADHLIPPWGELAAGLSSASDEAEAGAGENPEVSWPLTGERLVSVLESLLFAADKPLSVERIHELLEETASAPHKPSGPPLYKPQQLEGALLSLSELLERNGRGIGLHEVAGGWQLRTAPQNAPWVQRLLKQKPVRLSRAQLEALAIVAYRQPITRPEIDDIRGVDSGASLRMLLDRGLIRILGKKEEPGRPLLYGTTKEFLEFFNLKDLKDLPTLREYYDLTDESRDKVRAAGFEPPVPGPTQGTLPVDPVLAPPSEAAALVSPASSAAPATSAAAAPGDAAASVGTDPGSPAAVTARPVELIDQQLADDAENLAKIDEMIRAVNTAFPLLDPALFGSPLDATQRPAAASTETPTAAEPSTEPADGPQGPTAESE
jgi:segregation and condensation protein B